ncbi:MAG: PASTA domain-containing protein [Calditrichaeota bacterium]|nr:PASTA domain-containing protein [Calditrichota bacterium]
MIKKLFLWSAAAFIGLIVFVITCDQVIMPLYVKHGKDVVLPQVVGLPFAKADSLLKTQGFKAILDKEVYSSKYPKGTVTFQNPFPESIVKKGRRVYLTVSKGERRVAVPKLVGGSERDAELKLRRLGLKVGKKNYEFSTYFPKGVVVSQSVAPNDTLQVGQSVDFTVSLGDIPEHFIVPNLVGKSLKEATYILLHSGLKVGVVSKEVNNELLPDTVIRQSVPAGTEVEMGQAIDLVVSEFDSEGGHSASPEN